MSPTFGHAHRVLLDMGAVAVRDPEVVESLRLDPGDLGMRLSGELKDQGLAALLKGLAATSRGLCVVTTRYALP